MVYQGGKEGTCYPGGAKTTLSLMKNVREDLLPIKVRTKMQCHDGRNATQMHLYRPGILAPKLCHQGAVSEDHDDGDRFVMMIKLKLEMRKRQICKT